MKIIKNFAFALLTVLTFTASATSANDILTPIEEKQQLRVEVLKYIEATNIKKLHSKARIKFIVTTKDEIVVLNVRTDQQFVEQLIKDQLNYKRIKTNLSKKNQIYFIDITFDVG